MHNVDYGQAFFVDICTMRAVCIGPETKTMNHSRGLLTRHSHPATAKQQGSTDELPRRTTHSARLRARAAWPVCICGLF